MTRTAAPASAPRNPGRLDAEPGVATGCMGTATGAGPVAGAGRSVTVHDAARMRVRPMKEIHSSRPTTIPMVAYTGLLAPPSRLVASSLRISTPTAPTIAPSPHPQAGARRRTGGEIAPG